MKVKFVLRALPITLAIVRDALKKQASSIMTEDELKDYITNELKRRHPDYPKD